MNSDADIEKNGTCASPATARASSVLPVPGGPVSSTPRGIIAPSARYLSGFAEEVDDLDELLLGLVDTGHVVEGGAAGVGLVQLRLRLAEPADSSGGAGGAAHQPDEEHHEQDGRTEPQQHALPPRCRLVDRSGVDDHVLFLERGEQIVVGVGGALGLEGCSARAFGGRCRVGDGLAERPLDGLTAGGDLGDVSCFELPGEGRVGDGQAFLIVLQYEGADQPVDEKAASSTGQNRRPGRQRGGVGCWSLSVRWSWSATPSTRHVGDDGRRWEAASSRAGTRRLFGVVTPLAPSFRARSIHAGSLPDTGWLSRLARARARGTPPSVCPLPISMSGETWLKCDGRLSLRTRDG